MRLRPWRESDTAAILRLNDDNVRVLSPMDGADFDAWRVAASRFRVVESEGEVVAFLMAFAPGAAYASPNYLWFSDRLKNFLYIDRVVVKDSHRGRGIGGLCYRDLFGWARDNGFLWLAAEVDCQPPNAASLSFHDRQGFVEVGRQTLSGGKVVSLQVRPVEEAGD